LSRSVRKAIPAIPAKAAIGRDGGTDPEDLRKAPAFPGKAAPGPAGTRVALSRAGTTRLAIHHRLRDRRGRTTRGAKPSFWSRTAASLSLRRSRTSVGVLPIPSESTMTSAAGGSETMVTGCVDGLTKVAQPVEIASTATSSPRFDDVGFIRPLLLYFDSRG